MKGLSVNFHHAVGSERQAEEIYERAKVMAHAMFREPVTYEYDPYPFGTILRQAGTLDNRAMVIVREPGRSYIHVLFLGVLEAFGSIPEMEIANGTWVIET